MNNRIVAKIALTQIKMAEKTLDKLEFPQDRDKQPETDALAFAKFHCGVVRSYLESGLGHEKGEN
jgi:hypothetical protein